MKKLLFLLLFIPFLGNAQKGKYPPIYDYEWIIGTWQVTNAEGDVSYEQWQVENGKTLKGISYKITGKDTTIIEHIILKVKGDSLLYSPTVKEQNLGKQIDFLAVKPNSNKLIFENKKHDFPQQISYSRKGKKKAKVFIGGSINGRYRKLEFMFKRIS